MLDFVIGLLWGIGLTYFILNHFFTIERKHSYAWECDVKGCKFSVSTNDDDPMFLMSLVEGHKEYHVRK